MDWKDTKIHIHLFEIDERTVPNAEELFQVLELNLAPYGVTMNLTGDDFFSWGMIDGIINHIDTILNELKDSEITIEHIYVRQDLPDEIFSELCHKYPTLDIRRDDEDWYDLNN